jgi:hypothetical protein
MEPIFFAELSTFVGDTDSPVRSFRFLSVRLIRRQGAFDKYRWPQKIVTELSTNIGVYKFHDFGAPKAIETSGQKFWSFCALSSLTNFPNPLN